MTEGLMLKLELLVQLDFTWIYYSPAAHQMGHYHLQAVYSRKWRQQEFLWGIWSSLLPYQFHRLFRQWAGCRSTLPALILFISLRGQRNAILAKKHVIIEKPSCDHPFWMEGTVKLANNSTRSIFKGCQSIKAAFQVVKAFSSLTRKYWGSLHLYNILPNCQPFLQVRCQYFLRYLCRWSFQVDLGVYCCPAIILEPISSHYTAQQITQFGWSVITKCLDLSRFFRLLFRRENITRPSLEIYEDWNTNSRAVAAFSQGPLRQPFWGSHRADQAYQHQMQEKAEAFNIPSLIKSLLILSGYKQLKGTVMKPLGPPKRWNTV